MGAKTDIEWCDSTWNPIRGCSRVSEGCRHCYAEGMAARFSKPGLAYEGLAVMQDSKPHWTGKIEFVEKHLLDPLKWRGVLVPCPECGDARTSPCYPLDNGHRPGTTARPRRIFVNSMSDLFHENVTDEMRDKIFAVMALCPQHIFRVLTKRPHRMLAYMNSNRDGWTCKQKIAGAVLSISNALAANAGTYKARISLDHFKNCFPAGWGVFPNVWLGVSVENQAAADERIPLLLQTPAAVRFISAEPLLGPLKIHEYVSLPRRVRSDLPFPPFLAAGPGIVPVVRNPHGAVATLVDGQLVGLKPEEFELLPTLDWAICGGESGPGARPMHPDWARGLRDQCVAAGVPFFFKQWGEYLPAMTDGGTDRSGAQVLNASDEPQRVGKHAAGALLDGVEWKQFPEASPA